MRKKLILLPSFLIFLFVQFGNSTVIPDSLQQQLELSPDSLRLNIWRSWVETTTYKDLGDWESIGQLACSDAEKLLEQDSALIWCYKFHLSINDRFFNYNKYEDILAVLNKMKVFADSLTKIYNKPHEWLVSWYTNYGHFHYINRDMARAEEYYLTALEMNKQVQLKPEDYKLLASLGNINTVNNKPDVALRYFDQADSVAQVLNFPFKRYMMLKYYKAFAYSSLGLSEQAHLEYQAIVDSLHLRPEVEATRIKIDYSKNLCKLGKTYEGMKYLDELFLQIDTAENIINKSTYAESYCDCAMLAGDYQKGMEWNVKTRDILLNVYDERRNQDILKFEAEFKTAEKEAEIEKLEQEKRIEKIESRNRLIIISSLGLFALAILSFFLLQNKNKQRQLALKLEKDRQIAENRDRLYSSITHDIRTPLALMMAPLERIETKISDNLIKNDVHLAQRNGKRLMELFNQILDWNKAEAKAMKLNNQVGQLDFALNSLTSRFAQEASQNNIIFKHQLIIPKGQYSLDYDKMDKILSNLIGNAIKFCESGNQVDLRAELDQQNGNSNLILNVSDNGPGISETDQKNLFNRFYQGEQGQLKGGTGIGMALVKELVDLMQGQILLESKPGRGTRFSITLPIKKVSDINLMEPEPTAGTVEKRPSDKEKPLILIVEDEPELLNFLHSALADNFEVERAESANIGLSIAVSRIPDIIISDWTLPDHNGGWLSRELQKNLLTSHIPVMILTAHATDAHQQEAFDSGAVAWMTKPFKIDTLQKQLKTILDQQIRVQQNWASQILPESASDKEAGPADPFLQKVMQQIEANYADEFYTVEKMSEELFISRVQLFRKIKNLTGESPSTLIRTYRLDKARDLLKESGQTIAEVSFAVGFSDPSYFSRAYKQHFDTTPSQDMGNG